VARPFEDRGHLLRVATLFALGFTVFLVVRALLVPEGFGVYGHFRVSALEANRNRSLAYAGRAACAACHSEASDLLGSGKHAHVGCEACHGALARHASDPASQKGTRPDPRKVCLVCHSPSVTKPAGFPRILPADHAPEGSCTECHRPHAPTPE
jgi:Cytochrome c7 and related cytochrome c